MTDPADEPVQKSLGGHTWSRIYIAVIANTLIVILLLYAFYRHYAG